MQQGDIDMKRDIAITCNSSESFCMPDSMIIVCKNYNEECCQVVSKGLCTGKHRVEAQETLDLSIADNIKEEGAI